MKKRKRLLLDDRTKVDNENSDFKNNLKRKKLLFETKQIRKRKLLILEEEEPLLILKKRKKKKKKRSRKLVKYDPKADMYRKVYIVCKTKSKGTKHIYSKRVNALVCYLRQKGFMRVPEVKEYLYQCKHCPCDWKGQADILLHPDKYKKKRKKLKM